MSKGILPNAVSLPSEEAAAGYFAPDSLARRLNREAIVLLGGGCAVLLQLAHPFVAAGVEDHSQYQADTLGRLFRTMAFVDTLVFADRARADKALRHFHAMHDRVRGSLGDRAGNLPPGRAYSGVDPEAKRWVHATLVDTGLRTYELFVAPLSPDERRRYYEDSLTLGRLLGIPERLLPPTLPDFEDYLRGMLTGNTLAVTDTARRLADAALAPEVGFWPAQNFRLARLITAGLLPERFREAYGLPWGPRQRWLFRTLAGSYRRARPYLPAWFWKAPLRGGKVAGRLLAGNLKED